MLKADGFDEAIIGYTYDMVAQEERLIYSVEKCIEILMQDDMDYLEAREYLDFNTIGAYVGKQTPIFLEDIEGIDIK
ncbi:MAG: hypothetical protein CMQ53_00635 [Gammaproteobacteria bacterium]|nr:hypothetical protein [Gammaproteobacteria bacterium]|tara:strand:- start:631 stop:861 length:231 start_codon:yes stop_codon:yes gene_type:complete